MIPYQKLEFGTGKSVPKPFPGEHPIRWSVRVQYRGRLRTYYGKPNQKIAMLISRVVRTNFAHILEIAEHDTEHLIRRYSGTGGALTGETSALGDHYFYDNMISAFPCIWASAGIGWRLVKHLDGAFWQLGTTQMLPKPYVGLCLAKGGHGLLKTLKKGTRVLDLASVAMVGTNYTIRTL